MQIAIIGAGIAGVAAARALLAQGHAVTLFDKARAVGGRCATRRWDGHVVDHGAQYLTIRDARFRTALAAACGDALRRLEAPVVDATGAPLPDEGRWYHTGGNRAIVTDLARDLDLHLAHPIADAAVLLRANGGAFDHVVSTAPWPQTAALFGAQTAASADDDVPCLTLLLAYDGDWLGVTRTRYAVRDPDHSLAWSACENHKVGRIAGGTTLMVAQLSEAFSRTHLERAPEEYAALVRPVLEARWALPANRFRAAYPHRWRFARVRAPRAPMAWGASFSYVGDAIAGSRVESAWLAGTAITSAAPFA